MRVYGRQDLKWKNDDLHLDVKFGGVRKIENDLYRVRYPDGELSADYYNKTRAKEHATKIALRELNNSEENTTEDA